MGVPKSIARNLTFPEKVTKFNLKKMEQLVSNGTDIYPGRHPHLVVLNPHPYRDFFSVTHRSVPTDFSFLRRGQILEEEGWEHVST